MVKNMVMENYNINKKIKLIVEISKMEIKMDMENSFIINMVNINLFKLENGKTINLFLESNHIMIYLLNIMVNLKINCMMDWEFYN